jgi:hypothetical protein
MSGGGRARVARIVLVGSGALVAMYLSSYVVLRCAHVLVRREWFDTVDLGEGRYLTHAGSDVGYGYWWDGRGSDAGARLYWPLWQAELRLRGRYFSYDVDDAMAH